MKKTKLTLSFFISVFALFLFCVVSFAAQSGDVNGDGSITAEDARLCLRQAVGLEDFDPWSNAFFACDVTFDAEVTAEDARLILRAAVGLETLPDEEPVPEEGDALLNIGDAWIIHTATYTGVNNEGNPCYTFDLLYVNDTDYVLNMGYYNLGINGVIDGLNSYEEVAPHTSVPISTYIPFALLESEDYTVRQLEELVFHVFIYRLISNGDVYEIDPNYDFDEMVTLYPYGGGRSEYGIYYNKDHVLEKTDDMLIVFDGFTSQTYSGSGYVLDLRPDIRYLNLSDNEVLVEMTVTEINGKPANCNLSERVYGHYVVHMNDSLADMLEDDYYYANVIRFTINVYDVNGGFFRVFHGEYTVN